MPKTWKQGVKFWVKKIEENGQRSFGRGASNSAVRAFRKLANGPHRSVLKEPNLSVLSKMLGVHRKFTSRVLALLTGLGLATVETWSPVRIVFHRKHVLRGKNRAQKVRAKKMSPEMRAHLLREDHKLCGSCCKPLSLQRLQIDHIVPLRWRGADQPGNWLALCRRCNRKKWHNLESGFIKLYRGQRVKGPVGVRLKGDLLYLHINGKLCKETREEWKKAIG
jgi:hypothetical protein